MGEMIPYMKWKTKNVWNHQPDKIPRYSLFQAVLIVSSSLDDWFWSAELRHLEDRQRPVVNGMLATHLGMEPRRAHLVVLEIESQRVGLYHYLWRFPEMGVPISTIGFRALIWSNFRWFGGVPGYLLKPMYILIYKWLQSEAPNDG